MFAQGPETPSQTLKGENFSPGFAKGDSEYPELLEMQKENSLAIPGWFSSPAQVMKILTAMAKMAPRYQQTSLSLTGTLLSRR